MQNWLPLELDPRSMILSYDWNTYVLKGIARIHRKNNKHALTIAVICLCDSFVLLLAGSVPYLQLDPGAIYGDHFEDVVNADSHHVVIDEHALGITKQDVALTHP